MTKRRTAIDVDNPDPEKKFEESARRRQFARGESDKIGWQEGVEDHNPGLVDLANLAAV